MRYVGLADKPERKRSEHGTPPDFRVMRRFGTEEKARRWEKEMLTRGYEGDTGGAGWHFGYTFTLTRAK